MIAIASILVLAASLDADVREHADAILASQLPDGAIAEVHSGEEVSIVPYVGNQAAAGLYEAYRVTDDSKYLEAANAWVDWYLDHMGLDGKVSEYRGSREAYHAVNTGKVDVPGAATFLQCANMRRVLTKDRYFLLREQSKLWKVYETVVNAPEPDGLLYAYEDAPHKLTFYNIEAYEGLWHARQIARSLRDFHWNTEIYYARRGIESALERMRDENGLYAWAKSRDNTIAWPEDDPSFSTVGLANLAAAAYGPTTEREAKEALRGVRELFPDLGACTPAELFWWSAAACRVDEDSLAKRAAENLGEMTLTTGSPADHAYCIRTIVLAEEGEPRRFGVPMGSTYIPYQRSIFR